MKIELDISEDEITQAIKSRYKKAICDEVSTKISTKLIQEKIRLVSSDLIERMVKELILDSEEIKTRIKAEMEKEIKAKLKKLMD